MTKQKTKTCWEFFDCEESHKKICPAFLHDSGEECWFVAGSYSGRPNCTKLVKSIKSCVDCEWYKIHNK